MTEWEAETVGRIAETWSAEAVLVWAAEQFAPRITLATGFGAEGCVLLDMVARHRLPIDLFTLDTGLLFPETYALWRQLEDRYGLTIRGVRPEQSVDEQAAAHGDALWERDPNRCCGLRKVAPLRETLAGFTAWITAIRRDQTAVRSAAQAIEWDRKFNLAKVNPLVKWTKQDVWKYITQNDVPYNPLHDHGFPSIGCMPCTAAVQMGEDDRAGRWRGSSRTECGLHRQ
jgi:phosphoadenylyl-sulfate reductase (thioredoxin)